VEINLEIQLEIHLEIQLEIHFNFYEIDNDEAGVSNQKTITLTYRKADKLLITHLNRGKYRLKCQVWPRP